MITSGRPGGKVIELTFMTKAIQWTGYNASDMREFLGSDFAVTRA